MRYLRLTLPSRARFFLSETEAEISWLPLTLRLRPAGPNSIQLLERYGIWMNEIPQPKKTNVEDQKGVAPNGESKKTNLVLTDI